MLDFSSHRVLAKAKALTIRDDLSRGVANVINQLPTDLLQHVQLVSHSTTLTTNSIVEDRVEKSVSFYWGLMSIRWRRLIIFRVKWYVDVPTSLEMVVELDEAALRKAVTVLLKREAVDAIAVSSMMSVRNPSLEIRAAAPVETVLSGLAASVCGAGDQIEITQQRTTRSAFCSSPESLFAHRLPGTDR